MKISIITVVYNGSKTIHKAIESYLNQTHHDKELIIIDGGSTDGTIAKIKEYEKHIYKFISEKDDGIYDAINKGIELASGELIGILNCDDYFFNNNVLEKINHFHTINNIDFSIGNVHIVNKENKVVRNYSSQKWRPNYLKYGYMPPHPSIFIDSTVLSKFGNYRTDLKIAADYELLIRYSIIHKLRWKYSNIYTTIMKVGGVSSTGFKSYSLITKEINFAFDTNNIKYSKLFVKFRFTWKILLKILSYIRFS